MHHGVSDWSVERHLDSLLCFCMRTMRLLAEAALKGALLCLACDVCLQPTRMIRVGSELDVCWHEGARKVSGRQLVGSGVLNE